MKLELLVPTIVTGYVRTDLQKTSTETVQWYSRVQKSIENFIFRPKMAREGGLPFPLAFQYLILMI